MPPSKSPRLLGRGREAIRLKYFILSAEKAYVYYIRDFVFHN
ncbi:hypothetical protein [Leptolyngbya sp. BC1307]|nr:hypothetical protein [Leptolyngbya sp. BC1307]